MEVATLRDDAIPVKFIFWFWNSNFKIELHTIQNRMLSFQLAWKGKSKPNNKTSEIQSAVYSQQKWALPSSHES